MIKEKINTEEPFSIFYDVSLQMLQLVSSLTSKEINTIPFSGSWTAGQLVEHITKSIKLTAQALCANGTPAERELDKRVQELRETFLDFTVKFKSPDAVLPTGDNYDKAALIADLKQSVMDYKKASLEANPGDIITVKAFGELTKLELQYFALFHTQRHVRQLKKIVDAVTNPLAAKA